MKLGIIETIYFLFPKYYPRATRSCHYLLHDVYYMWVWLKADHFGQYHEGQSLLC